MKSRLHMNGKGNVFVETEDDAAGMEYMKELRHLMGETFKNSRIKKVIQAYPSKIPTNVILER